MDKKYSEAVIIKGILDFLKMHKKENDDIYFLRVGTGKIMIGTRFFKSGKPGAPDIVAVYRGRFLGIEVKSSVGIQSEVQQEAEKEIIKAGGFYVIAKSNADIRQLLARVRDAT